VSSTKVAVIDVGSNTIKLLVAEATTDKALKVVHQASMPTRIGSGIGRDQPALAEESMKAGVETIQELLEAAEAHLATSVRLVATGAVRDAHNGNEFSLLVQDATGLPLHVLTGQEEANGIALGLLSDPALSSRNDFLACDLGGGSLELVSIEGRFPKKTISLPLGAVRLTEKFVSNPQEPIPDCETKEIAKEVKHTLTQSEFSIPKNASILVATGGSFYTARSILAKREEVSFEKRSILTRDDFLALLEETASLNLEERYRHFPGLPPNRADVMVAAFVCIIELLEYAQVSTALNSLRNLRYGIAAKLLA
tara:strand:+ start:575 stop:1507 length:933 start_codon:yes stop_codon:yes gene_type:complete